MELRRFNLLIQTRNKKPQEQWEWPIAVDLYIAGIGGGSFITGVVVDWLGYSVFPSKAILLWGALLTVFAIPFIIMDLGKKWRFLYACLNPRTSWLSRGFLILSAFILVGIAALIVSLLPLLDIRITPIVLRVLESIGVILAFATAVYSGLLFKAVRYVTFWDTWLLPVLFIISALSGGMMVIILSISGASLFAHEGNPNHLMELLISVELALLVAEGVVLSLFLILRYRIKELGKYSVRVLLSGHLKFVFWIGSIVSHFLIPIILLSLYSSRLPYMLFVAGFFLLLGGLLFRLAIVRAGIKRPHPLLGLIEILNSGGNA